MICLAMDTPISALPAYSQTPSGRNATPAVRQAVSRKSRKNYFISIRTKGGFAMNMKLIINLILAGLALIFIIQNITVVEVRFLFWTLSMSRALLMFFILAIGMIVGWSLHGLYVPRRTGRRNAAGS
jgi:uncharacterized integral membrane protein